MQHQCATFDPKAKSKYSISIHSLNCLSSSSLDDIERISSLSQESTPFHSRTWINACILLNSKQAHCAFLIVNEVRVGFMLYDVIRTLISPAKIKSPSVSWVTPYGGPVFLPGVTVSRNEFIVQCSKMLHCHYAYVIHSPFSMLSLNDNIYNIVNSVTETSVIDISVDTEVLFNSIHSKTRNMIRKATKSGVVVSSEGATSVCCFIKMLEFTLAGKGMHLIGHTMLEYLLSSDHCFATMHFARIDSVPVASVVNLHYKNTSYYWLGASYPDGKAFGANDMLQWNAIKVAKELGSTRYDMVRLDKDRLPGITRFKQRYGGGTCGIPVTTWQSTVWSIARKVRSVMRLSKMI